MISIIGWFGTLLYLVNHAYISIIKNWKPKIYYIGNAIAAISLILSSYISSSWQAVVINSFWAIISLALLMGVDLKILRFSQRFFYLVMASTLLVILGQLIVTYQLNFTLLGWSSAFAFSACYLLFCQEKMLPRYYLCWNAFAAIALLPQLWYDANWPVFGLEVIWAMISIYGAARKFEEVHLL